MSMAGAVPILCSWVMSSRRKHVATLSCVTRKHSLLVPQVRGRVLDANLGYG